MKRQKVFTEKPANAKLVFKGVVVEIKKVSDQEVELAFPDNVDTKELLSYLESFGVLKRKLLVPHSEQQPEAQTEEDLLAQRENQEKQVKEDNVEEAGEEDSTETKVDRTEELSRTEDTSTTKRRTRKSKNS